LMTIESVSRSRNGLQPIEFCHHLLHHLWQTFSLLLEDQIEMIINLNFSYISKIFSINI
jgi:hypothetical protein